MENGIKLRINMINDNNLNNKIFLRFFWIFNFTYIYIHLYTFIYILLHYHNFMRNEYNTLENKKILKINSIIIRRK